MQDGRHVIYGRSALLFVIVEDEWGFSLLLLLLATSCFSAFLEERATIIGK